MKNWNWHNVYRNRTPENIVAQIVVSAVLIIGYITVDMISWRRTLKHYRDVAADITTDITLQTPVE